MTFLFERIEPADLSQNGLEEAAERSVRGVYAQPRNRQFEGRLCSFEDRFEISRGSARREELIYVDFRVGQQVIRFGILRPQSGQFFSRGPLLLTEGKTATRVRIP